MSFRGCCLQFVGYGLPFRCYSSPNPYFTFSWNQYSHVFDGYHVLFDCVSLSSCPSFCDDSTYLVGFLFRSPYRRKVGRQAWRTWAIRGQRWCRLGIVGLSGAMSFGCWVGSYPVNSRVDHWAEYASGNDSSCPCFEHELLCFSEKRVLLQYMTSPALGCQIV